MSDIFSFLWDQSANMFLWKGKQTDQSFSVSKVNIFYWVSCSSQLTRDHVWKCDK